jgi:DNA-binding CsgD family transcriptional regulator
MKSTADREDPPVVGIVGGQGSVSDRIRDSLTALGYKVAFTVPHANALEEGTPLKADAVIMIRPSRSNQSVLVSIDGKGIIRAAGPIVSDPNGRATEPELTNREKQSLSLVIMGMTNRQIADKLFISESTVKSHLNTAYRKLGVRSRAEATRLIADPRTGLGMGILAITRSGLTGRSGE